MSIGYNKAFKGVEPVPIAVEKAARLQNIVCCYRHQLGYSTEEIAKLLHIRPEDADRIYFGKKAGIRLVVANWTFLDAKHKFISCAAWTSAVETRVQILNLLVEGSSLPSISRVCGVSINTVTKLLVDAGMACATFHDEIVRNVAAKRVQCDEIWSFCYAKDKNVRSAKAAPEALAISGRGRRSIVIAS
jgi:hypothetical protein